MILTFGSTNWMPHRFQQNIFAFTMTYSCNNILLKSSIHIPRYDSFLSFNVTLLLCIVTKSMSNIFVYFKYSFLLLKGLTPILPPKFSIFLLYTSLFINLYSAFPSLSPFFSASIHFCVLTLTHGFSCCDWFNSHTRCFF